MINHADILEAKTDVRYHIYNSRGRLLGGTKTLEKAQALKRSFEIEERNNPRTHGDTRFEIREFNYHSYDRRGCTIGDTTDRDMQADLMNILAEQLEEASVRTFEDAGIMTRDKGLVIYMPDGTEFQLTIVQSA